MALVTLAYRRADAALPDGSGFLVPPVDGRTIKAVDVRLPQVGLDRRREPGPHWCCAPPSAGTARRRSSAATTPTWSGCPAHDLRAAAGLDAAPVAARVTRWDDGLPQYPVGHHARVARIREHVGRLPGLAVCGAAYDGVGIPACIASANAAVDGLGGDLGGLDAMAADPVQSLHGGAGE